MKAQWTTNGSGDAINNNTSGKVGIGVNPPLYNLDVWGTIRSNGYLRTTQVGNGYGYYADDGAGSTIFSITRQPTNEARFQSYGYHTFYSGGNTGSEKMRIDPNGNVGIGTTNPGVKLVVNGAGGINTDMVINGRIQTGDASNAGGVWVSGSGNMFMGQATTTAMGWYNNGSWRMIADNAGNVGIGTLSPTQKLTVNGTIYGKEVKVDLSVPGPDYVFANNYQLLTLNELKTYIDQHKHLPEVPSAKEMEKDGIQLGEMNMLLLKKIEELTLHLIEQEKKIEFLNRKVKSLELSK